MVYTRGTFQANPAQSEAITHPPAPLMVLAGAGTGKTTTLLHRILYLIEHRQVTPGTILTITYTEKAAAELKERIQHATGIEAGTMQIGTFHSFCYRVVCETLYRFKPAPVLMEDGDALFLLLERFDELAPFVSRTYAVNPVKAVTRSWMPFFNRLRDALIDPRSLVPPQAGPDTDPEIPAQLEDLLRIYPLYQQWKSEQNLVDYGDMITRCWELMQADPEVRRDLQDRYQHIIVDEFQDNNHALNEVMYQIAQAHGSITVVGDDDQVIYGFRGASAYNIKDFRERYHQWNHYREVTLEENYRSTQQILEVANAVIRNNTGRISKHLKAKDGKSGLAPALYWGDTAAQNHNLPVIIRELSESQQIPFGDMAVLCRTRAQVAEAAAALQAAHIPADIFITEYFQIPVIRQILAWCQVVAGGPQADSALYRLLQSEIGPAAAQRWFGAYHHRVSGARLDLFRRDPRLDSDPGGPAVRELLDRIIELRRIPAKSAGERVWDICIRSRLFRKLVNRYELSDRIAMLNLGDFLWRSQEFSRRHQGDNSLLRFIRYMDTLRSAGSIPALFPSNIRRSAAVRVQTVHGAKGQEFPVVIIPYNQTQRFPLQFRRPGFVDGPPLDRLPGPALDPRERHTEEERRLFYVGLTRARERLILMAPEKRTSKFIREIPRELLESNTMTETASSPEPDILDRWRAHYEKRITDALALEQYDRITAYLKALERLADLRRGKPVTWGQESWEQELSEHLQGHPPAPLPEHPVVSASALETYAQCPLKYRLGYIDNIPVTADKPQLVFGTIIHKVLEEFHKHQMGGEQDLLDLLEQNWRSAGFEYESREKSFHEQGVQLLQRYARHIQADPPHVEETEHRFQLELGSCTLIGKIDRIDKGSKGFRVIDYKTGTAKSNPRDSLQLAVYCLYLAHGEAGRFKGYPEQAGLFFLRDDEEPLVWHTFTAPELDQAQEKINAYVSGITRGEFDHCQGYHCEWCDYRDLLCPAWEDTL